MKNIVSFETAKALKAAGFPQPEPEWGQFWYNNHEMLFICERQRMEIEDYVFAPIATDILEQLPDESMFIVFKNAGPNGETAYRCQTAPHVWKLAHNPAEAAAAAWLAIKKDLEV